MSMSLILKIRALKKKRQAVEKGQMGMTFKWMTWMITKRTIFFKTNYFTKTVILIVKRPRFNKR